MLARLLSLASAHSYGLCAPQLGRSNPRRLAIFHDHALRTRRSRRGCFTVAAVTPVSITHSTVRIQPGGCDHATAESGPRRRPVARQAARQRKLMHLRRQHSGAARYGAAGPATAPAADHLRDRAERSARKLRSTKRKQLSDLRLLAPARRATMARPTLQRRRRNGWPPICRRPTPRWLPTRQRHASSASTRPIAPTAARSPLTDIQSLAADRFARLAELRPGTCRYVKRRTKNESSGSPAVPSCHGDDQHHLN